MTNVDHASERPLLAEEINIVRALLVAAGSQGERYLDSLESRLVIDLDDGGMRSVRFIQPGKRLQYFKRSLSSAKYLDKDGVLVLLDLYLVAGCPILCGLIERVGCKLLNDPFLRRTQRTYYN
jgi:hypothetical protein